MDEEILRRVDSQLWDWCVSIVPDIEAYFKGKAIVLNNKISAMADLNDLDRTMLRKYVFLFWVQRQNQPKNEKEAEERKKKRIEIVKAMMKVRGRSDDIWFLRG